MTRMANLKDEAAFAEYQSERRTRWATGTGATAMEVDTAPQRASVTPPIYPLVRLCRAEKLPEPTPEFVFHPTRKWRFDYAWPLQKVAVEIEGGVWTQGRHTRGSGFVADMLKYNAAALLGWRVLRYQPQHLKAAITDLKLEFAKGCQ